MVDGAPEPVVERLGRGEGGEVVVAVQRVGAGGQCTEVELAAPEQRVALTEHGALAAMPDAVPVGAADGLVAGVKAGARRLAADDRDVAGQEGVQVVRGEGFAVVGDDLAPGVHAGVGAATDDDAGAVAAEDLSERALELPFDGAFAGLLGPADEVGAVVLDDELRRPPAVRRGPRRRQPWACGVGRYPLVAGHEVPVLVRGGLRVATHGPTSCRTPADRGAPPPHQSRSGSPPGPISKSIAFHNPGCSQQVDSIVGA